MFKVEAVERKLSFSLVVFVILIFISGCGNQKTSEYQADENIDSEVTNIVDLDDKLKFEPNPNGFRPFYIFLDKGSRENHFSPSGFMPDGKCVRLRTGWTEGCQSGKSCIRLDYHLECSENSQRWAGIYWLNPANNWGRRNGGFDLTGARQLTFWARGENGGEQVQEFTIGGIEGDYPDSDKIMIGPVILSEEWRKYTIDLTGRDLRYISGGFAWTTDVEVNTGEKMIFYLDEIRFE